jgi:hypothetical protein
MGVEDVAQPVGLRALREVERREEGPDAVPGAGEDAGPGGGAGGELEEDEDEDVVGERAEPVLACGGGGAEVVGGEPRALGGALAAADASRLHRECGVGTGD